MFIRCRRCRKISGKRRKRGKDSRFRLSKQLRRSSPRLDLDDMTIPTDLPIQGLYNTPNYRVSFPFRLKTCLDSRHNDSRTTMMFYVLCYQARCKKKPWTCSIVGLSSGLTAQQRIISSHKPSGAWFFHSDPSGRSGRCFLVVFA